MRARRSDTLRVAPCFVAALVATATLSAQKTPPWRVLRDMEVDGSPYERDAIAGALAADSVTMQLLRRRLDEVAATGVAQRVATMHCAGGYHTARAAGRFVDGELRIEVTAGARRRWHAVRCVGNEQLTDEQLVARLTSPRKPTNSTARAAIAAAARSAPVPIGAFADTTGARLGWLQKVVVRYYEHIGRYGADVRVAVEPAGEELDLVVTITDEGREATMGQLELHGEADADTAAAITAWAAPERGLLATHEVREQLRKRIESTARYSKVEVELAPPPTPEAASVVLVTVERVPDPTPFDTDDLEHAEWIDRSVNRTLSRLQNGEQLHVEAVLDRVIAVPPLLTLHPGKVGFTFGAEGLRLAAESIAWGDGPAEPAALQLAPEGLQFVAGTDRDVFSNTGESLLAIQFQITTELLRDGSSSLRWGVGATTGAYPEFAANLHPSFATKLLGHATDVRYDAGDLLLQLGDTTLRIGEDGEVRDQPVELTAADVDLAFALSRELQPIAIDAETDPHRGALARTLVAVLGQLTPHPTDRERIVAMIRAVLAAWPERSGDTTANDLPTLAGEGGEPEDFAGKLAGLAMQPCVRRAWTGDLVEACGCISSYLLRDRDGIEASWNQLLGAREAGPLVISSFARLLALMDPRAIERLMPLARERWSFDAAWDDAADLLSNFPSLSALPTRAGARFRADPTLQQLFVGLPDGPAGDRRAFRIGVRYWWSHGGESMLKKLLLR